ncbi:uncharacterized protein MAL13P1.304 [Patella vulgata]|uniref:uncharacterized protein MAL13P1.304 n=1 Tax=Patella vulgata TaxID=6465 RepID=UPI0024A7FF8D|nr:uncharacterized protein MAL13P1.304 [Patella vulgata]
MSQAVMKCGFCKRGKEVEDVCGELHHVKTPKLGKPCTAHHKCMQYSAMLIQYTDSYFGGFKIDKVLEEQKRGRFSKCTICKSKKGKSKGMLTGATSGCAVQSCRKTFHFYCARTSNECITKRLVVSFKSSGKITVLYRVFCSKEHEKLYRENLKDYSKDMNKNDQNDDSDEDEDDDDDDDDDDDEDNDLVDDEDFSMNDTVDRFGNNNHDTTNICISSPNIPSGKKTIKKTPKLENPDDMINLKRMLDHINFERECPRKKKTKLPDDKSSEEESAETPPTDEEELDCSVLSTDQNGNCLKEKTKTSSNPLDNTTTDEKNESSTRKPSPVKSESPIKSKASTENIRKSLEYAVCILSSTDKIEEQRRELRDIIASCYTVDRIVIWQDISSNILNKDLTPYFMHSISKEMISNSTKTLRSLLFSESYLKKKRDTDYLYQSTFIKDLKDPVVDRNVLQSTWKTISNNLKTASASKGILVGELVSVTNSKALILFIGDVLDKDQTIRSKFPEETPTVYTWGENTSLTTFTDDNYMYNQTEVDILSSYLDDQKQPISDVVIQPNDNLLLKSLNSQTVVSHLVDKYRNVAKKEVQYGDPICLILLTELDTKLINVENYVHKMLNHFITEKKSQYSNFIVLLPVTGFAQAHSFHRDIKNCVQGKVDVQVISAYDPKANRISCVFVEMKILPGVSNSAKSKPAVVVRPYIQDGEMPSTSGTSKKRRLKATLSPSALSFQHNLKK